MSKGYLDVKMDISKFLKDLGAMTRGPNSIYRAGGRALREALLEEFKILVQETPQFSGSTAASWQIGFPEDTYGDGTPGSDFVELPKPAGAETLMCPLALTPPRLTEASALARSLRMRWQSSRKALPSKVRLSLRVVRSSNLTPRRSSSASMRRPIIAGVTPSARAAADRLPRLATLTKAVISLKLLILY